MKFISFQLNSKKSIIFNIFTAFRKTYERKRLPLFGHRNQIEEIKELGGRIVHRNQFSWYWMPFFDFMTITKQPNRFTVFSNDPLEMIVAVEYAAWSETNEGKVFNREKFIDYVAKKFKKDREEVFDATLFAVAAKMERKS